MSKNLEEYFNITENKKVDYSKYSLAELTYTLTEVLLAITKRKKDLSGVHSSVDLKRNEVYHEIEFGDFTDREKLLKYSELEETLRDRRKVKHAEILIEWIWQRMNPEKTSYTLIKMIETLGGLEKKGTLCRIITPEYKKGEVTRLHKKYAKKEVNQK